MCCSIVCSLRHRFFLDKVWYGYGFSAWTWMFHLTVTTQLLAAALAKDNGSTDWLTTFFPTWIFCGLLVLRIVADEMTPVFFRFRVLLHVALYMTSFGFLCEHLEIIPKITTIGSHSWLKIVTPMLVSQALVMVEGVVFAVTGRRDARGLGVSYLVFGHYLGYLQQDRRVLEEAILRHAPRNVVETEAFRLNLDVIKEHVSFGHGDDDSTPPRSPQLSLPRDGGEISDHSM